MTIWLDKTMSWFAAASGKRGCNPKFSDAAIQFCLSIKNLFGQSAQRRCFCAPQRCYRRMQAPRSQAQETWSGYLRRGLVETKMNCVKRLGERVMSRTFERQVSELHF